jgi:GST-like protein
MIEFYTAATSNGQRVAIMLEECAVPYRVHHVDLAQAENRREEYLQINPAGQIPAILDPEGPGGQPFALGQSAAILLYLAEKTGRFLPVDAHRRAVAYQWLMQALTDVASASTGIFLLSNLMPDKSPANLALMEDRLVRFLRLADAQLADREYLADELSVADFALYPICMARRAVVERAGVANLSRWVAAIGQRAAVTRAMQGP